ncbi:MAG: type VI secretion system baseplate subunit TssK [Rhodospirillales bacterium]|nr:type VI secretion system baseplate subunit TssK [Rhodospirillales bacterium]
MTWTNRVAWQEGMFLRAQHFQQLDRALESVLLARTAALQPYGWGLVNCVVNRDMLSTGSFAVTVLNGVFEDGTPFSIPGDADHPSPLEIPEGTRNALVHLTLPVRQPGAVEMASAESPEGRYRLTDFSAYDTHSASPQPAELQVGRLRLDYMLEEQRPPGYVGIALARIVEVTADRRVILDDRWIPPALLCSAAPPLAGLLSELAGLLNQRGEALAARMTAPGARGVSDVSDFMLLQCVNRWQKLISHWADAGAVHPVDVYAALVQMAGDLATFIEASRRPAPYPPYRHEDLQRSFAPVVADLRRYFSAVIEQTAIPIPLQDRRGVRVGPIVDRGILRATSFVLCVQADMPTERLQRLFPSQVKIGAVEHIRELVNVALPGISVRPLPVAPRQLPYYAGASYFELDRKSPHWQHMQSAGGFAVHVSGDFPNLNLELWAIRG